MEHPKDLYHPYMPPRRDEGDFPDWFWVPHDEEVSPGTWAQVSMACLCCGAGPGDDHSVLCPSYWEERMAEAVCAVLGHDLVDNGWAGPESGCIALDCRRCGFSYGRQWLY